MILADIEIPDWAMAVIIPVVLAVLGLIAQGLRYLNKLIADKIGASDTERELMGGLTEGIVTIQRTYVDALKEAAADGRLTADEMNTAKEKAIDEALTVLKGPAKALALQMGRERLGALVELLLGKLKISGFGAAPSTHDTGAG